VIEMKEDYFHSVVLNESRCVGCTGCLKSCPTEAIRLIGDKACIIGEKCIDCGECIRICPNHAKSAVTDNVGILKRFKYTIAIPSLVLYGQFPDNTGVNEILRAVKKIGFDEIYEASEGTEVVTNIMKNYVLKNSDIKRPVINSSCPAIIRLIQIRFPELLPNIANIATPAEIAARLVKTRAAGKTGLSMDEIGVIFISPCTARMTSVKNPLGIKKSYIDGILSMKDIYGEILRNLGSTDSEDVITASTKESVLWLASGGQGESLGIDNYLAVDGIWEVLKVLEEIDMDKLSGLEFFEGMACVGGCAGGPLTIENPFIARNRMKAIAKKLPSSVPDEKDIKEHIEMFKSGFVRLTEPIEPKDILQLDNNISKSIKKMEMIKDILKQLPGIDCGICGAPTCRAFAEDIVKGENQGAVCMVKTMEGFRSNGKA